MWGQYIPIIQVSYLVKTLKGCYSVSNGHAAFKLVFKLVLFSKTLEGCYSVSDGHAAKLDQFACFLQLFTVTFFSDWKEISGVWRNCSQHRSTVGFSLTNVTFLLQKQATFLFRPRRSWDQPISACRFTFYGTKAWFLSTLRQGHCTVLCSLRLSR